MMTLCMRLRDSHTERKLVRERVREREGEREREMGAAVKLRLSPSSECKSRRHLVVEVATAEDSGLPMCENKDLAQHVRTSLFCQSKCVCVKVCQAMCMCVCE